MHPESHRKKFLFGIVLGGMLAATSFSLLGSGPPASSGAQDKKDAAQPKHEHHMPATVAVGSAKDRGKLLSGFRKAGLAPVLVETPDVPKLEWKMVKGAKEFHLYAKHMKREFLPGQWFDVWGYNGSMPGPTIEAIEGDRVRVIVHNDLPEATSMHWHGLEVPNGMDGVIGLTQDAIEPGEVVAYEFDLKQNGTFFYHTHVAMQQALGLVGLFIIHPTVAHGPPVDRDFAIILQEWAILPGASITNTMSMEFNLFTINGRSAPYMSPLVIKQGERVRIRIVNFSVIDHHPMHLHGLTFWITGTEAGRIPDTAWIPSNNVLVAVAQSRDIEFVANNPGDWVMHCHMFHHMMNFMSSMVGSMRGEGKGMQAGGSMATGMGMLTRGSALSREFGPQLGRGTGEQTGSERAVGNGGMNMKGMGKKGEKDKGMEGMDMKGEKDDGMKGMDMKSKKDKGMKGMDMKGMDMKAASRVPGFPQNMAGMANYSKGELKKLNRPETRGMREGWYEDVEGLTTIIRVLPPALYDKVVSGKGEVAPGASVFGGGPVRFGGPAKVGGHEGHGNGKKKEPGPKGHEGHKKKD